MFDHIMFGVGDYATSKALFPKALEPIGMTVVPEGPPGIEPSADGKASLCLTGTTSRWWSTRPTPERRFRTPPAPRARRAEATAQATADGLRVHVRARHR
jgi:hypothetical protein